MTAGLCHGELRALRVDDLDFANKRINVSRGWDQYEGEIDVKSEKGKRSTVIIAHLGQRLTEHIARTGASGKDLVFGRDAITPFASSTVNNRARRAWAAARELEDLENEIPQAERIHPIGLHECRHMAVSQMLDAGVSIDKVSKFMGHASIAIIVDRYSHLLPGGEAEAAALLDAYHDRRRRQRAARNGHRTSVWLAWRPSRTPELLAFPVATESAVRSGLQQSNNRAAV